MDLKKINKKIRENKRIYSERELKEKDVDTDPFSQFLVWFDEVFAANVCDPTAMVLATVDHYGNPDARVVLLKELEDNQFIFYSNYNSNKGKQLEDHHIAAINFYWSAFSRQVRIKGRVVKVDRKKNEEYFATRPRDTQLGTYAWVQSSVLKNREEIKERINLLAERYENKLIECPDYWGGYALIPFEYEFFQGTKWRFNDRLLYTLDDKNEWQMMRLAP